MLYGIVITVHVFVCLALIAVILLQAGRGGGLSETFGGDSSQTIFGTKMSVFLTKATVVVAALFLITCLALGIMTSRRGRSLIDMQKRRVPLSTNVPLQGPIESPEKDIIDKEDFPLAKPEDNPKK